MIDPRAAEEFLTSGRIAVVGVSEAPGNFGRTVYRALRSRGHDAVPVHPHAGTVDGDRCHTDLASVPMDLDGVIVMVDAGAALDVVRSCVSLGIPRVWLFKGLGGDGALSEDAVRLCVDNGISVVAGACPMMFLEPVGWGHRIHRRLRYRNGSLAGHA